MKLQCIATLPNEQQATLLSPYYQPGKQQFGLAIGREYVALGLTILQGVPWVELASDAKFLYSVPLCLFKIIDGQISRYWEARLHENGNLTLWPSSFYQEYYHDDLLEGVPEIVTNFGVVCALLETESRLSEDFYTALMAGQLAIYDEYDETRTDFSRWKGIYETWLRRKQAYTAQINKVKVIETLSFQPAY